MPCDHDPRPHRHLECLDLTLVGGVACFRDHHPGWRAVGSPDDLAARVSLGADVGGVISRR